MKRFTFLAALLLALIAVTPADAQVSGGNISGIVTDEQGAVLPGVTVTLTSTDRTASFTTEEDGRFRFLALPPGMYTVTASLQGFTKVVREAVEVRIGQNVDIPVSLRVAALEESITVTGESPIVDTKAMGTATNFTKDELDKIPTSRDPWALLRTVPGVVVDRINIAGNETGQQSGFASKGTRPADAVWTMDGVVITDMAAIGASPTYFDYDAFDEIQISTNGQDIRQSTGGVGLNMVVKRGTNQFRGNFKGFFTGEGLESDNVPEELQVVGPVGQLPVTPETADHNKQISEYGFDIGGPIWRDKAWFWGSWVKQDIRLNRSSGNLIDKTLLTTRNLKLNWQATSKDMISFLSFLGSKEKFGRGTGAATFEPPSATWTQGGIYEGGPHGLTKIQDDRILTSSLFLTAKYAYYNTGFGLIPAGGIEGQAGISTPLASSFGTTRQSTNIRPQHTFGVDLNHFRNGFGASHDIKFGASRRTTEAETGTLWPGDLAVGYEFSASDTRARLYREGLGRNRTEYTSFYVGDTMSMDRVTFDIGLRYDRQGGSALESKTASNGLFPNLVPGIEFAGYEAPFEFSDFSPRVGLTYALDESRKTLIRASFTRFAGQLSTGEVGYMNPAGSVGFADYRWNDLNGDHFVSGANEVDLNTFIGTGGGFNRLAPTSVSSSFLIDPGLDALKTTGVVIGFDRELMPNLAVQVAYNWSRSTDYYMERLLGPTSDADYALTHRIVGTLPNGTDFDVPVYQPNAALSDANGNGRILTNYEGYSSKFNGIEFQLIKRYANKWMARFSGSYNNATEDYENDFNYLGNPTRRDTEPLGKGGQFAPRSAGSGAGDVFINAKWQVNMNGAYSLPWDMEVAGNLFGKQGTPFPLYQQVSLGRDGSNRVLLTPDLDTFRLPNVWNLDLRWSKTARFGTRANAQFIVDLFNVTNANYSLNQIRLYPATLVTVATGASAPLASPNFNRISQNLSPRILRFGLRLGF